MSEAYSVEESNPGCPACGSKRTWDVVFKSGTSEELALSTSYGDHDDAQHMADNMNTAYVLGFANAHPTIEATRAEAERPKVELNPYTFSEACAIYEKLLGEKFELERKLRAALTEIADFKAMLGTDQIERLKARLQK